MFCPQCGSEASVGLRYCRGCGLQLSLIEAALDTRLEHNAEQLRRSAGAIKIGLIGMAIFGLIAIASAWSSRPFDVTIGPLLISVSSWGWSLFFALLVGMQAIAVGYRRLRRVAQDMRALTGSEGASEVPLRIDRGSGPPLPHDTQIRRT
jgi:hypothetical protein